MNNFTAHTSEIRQAMLDDIGVSKVEDLFSQIPDEARVRSLNLPEPLSEMELVAQIKSLARENNVDCACFLGGGAYKRFIPACVGSISSRFEFNTAYTPYQPEISQGTLQVIYEFQSMICELTGMDVSNASIYDGATALAECALMGVRVTGKSKVLISDCINPDYKIVIETYLKAAGIEFDYLPVSNGDLTTDLTELKVKVEGGEYAIFLIQTPNFYGSIENTEILKDVFENSETLLGVSVDLIATSVLNSPKEYNADIVVSDTQQLGNSISFGGPYAGVIACLDKYKRNLAGRIVGLTVDADGKRAFTLTLQTREQHIRREKATSNICSNQALCALNSTVYLSVMGKFGLEQVSYLSSKNAHYLAKELSKKGFKILNEDFFNEFTIETKNADEFLLNLKKNDILGGIKLDKTRVLVACTELNSQKEIDKYLSNVKS